MPRPTLMKADKNIHLFWQRIDQLKTTEIDLDGRAFYSAISDHSNRTILNSLLTSVLDQRPHIPRQHLAYLLLASFRRVSGLHRTNSPRWSPGVVEAIYSAHLATIIQMCVDRNIQAHVPRRYAGLRVVLSMLGRQAEVRRVADRKSVV